MDAALPVLVRPKVLVVRVSLYGQLDRGISEFHSEHLEDAASGACSIELNLKGHERW
jgi:hypothetical protein